MILSLTFKKQLPLWVVAFFLFNALEIRAQSVDNQTDTTSLLHAFQSGKYSGNFRYYFMATDNARGLTDYFANAAGGGLRYQTGEFHRFSMSSSGYFIFNIGSSDLALKDPVTGQSNRYEIGLFDLEDPNNKTNINRLEELYLQYRWKKTTLKYGRQLINTPFINLQDGRMRPTIVSGLWFTHNTIKKTRMEGGWISAISPRSTTRWLSIGESFGINPTGVNPDGTPSGYKGNTESKGVGLLGITQPVGEHLKVQVWDTWVQHVFNTAMVQAEVTFSQKNGSSWFGAAQLIRQDALADGGNPDPEKAYFPKNGKALTWGLQAGWKNKQWKTTLNYNRITGAGRYLMPREWGRDPFFTFMPRERTEGLSDAHALMLQVQYSPLPRLQTALSGGIFSLHDPTEAAYNKYRIPAYGQINGDITLRLKGLFEGIDFHLLVAAKPALSQLPLDPRFEFNKVNMISYNLVGNYHF